MMHAKKIFSGVFTVYSPIMKHMHVNHHIRRREYTGEGAIIFLRGAGDDNLEYGLRDLPRRGVVG